MKTHFLHFQTLLFNMQLKNLCRDLTKNFERLLRLPCGIDLFHFLMIVDISLHCPIFLQIHFLINAISNASLELLELIILMVAVGCFV